MIVSLGNVFSAKIKIDTYALNNSDNDLVFRKSNVMENVLIYKKTIIFILNGRPVKISKNLFEYTYDLPFVEKIEIENKSKIINAKITYIDTGVEILKQGQGLRSIECYTHLSYLQKIKNSYYFNRLWIQQTSNIMWIINILVAILACLTALKKSI